MARDAHLTCGLCTALIAGERERCAGARFVRGGVHWSEQTAPISGLACVLFNPRIVTDVTYPGGATSEGFGRPALYFRDSTREPIP